MEHLRPGTRECQCAVCKQYFSSPWSFDMHRAGDWDNRRCLTAREMRRKGMVKDGKGRWQLAAEGGGAGGLPPAELGRG